MCLWTWSTPPVDFSSLASLNSSSVRFATEPGRCEALTMTACANNYVYDVRTRVNAFPFIRLLTTGMISSSSSVILFSKNFFPRLMRKPTALESSGSRLFNSV